MARAFFVMARLDRAIYTSTVPRQMARSSRAMTKKARAMMFGEESRRADKRRADKRISVAGVWCDLSE